MDTVKNLKPIAKEAVEKLAARLPFASAFACGVEGRTAGDSTFSKGAGFKSPDTGITLTAFTGDHFIELSSNHLDADSVHKQTDDLLAMCERVGINPDGLKPDPGQPLEQDYAIAMQKDARSLPLREMTEKAAELRHKVQTISPKIVNCGVNFGHESRYELYVNPVKTLYQELHRWDSMAYAVFNDEGRTSQIWTGHGRQGGWEHMEIDQEELAKVMADGERLITAPRLNPGWYDCVFSPGMAGMFAHEAFGHGTETDMYIKHRAKGAEYMGRQVAAPIVNMYDSPALPGEAGSYFFDNEGQPAVATKVIDNGILVSGLTDMNSAMRLGYNRTPNGRRQAYSHKAYARMTNTYFEPGNDSFEAMISSIEHGYLVDYPTNGMEDPKGWGIQLEALYAREIKNGKLTDNYFTPVIVTGYVPELLNSITMLGPSRGIFGLGSCGKGHKEWVKVSDGGPYMKLRARLA